MKKEIKLADLVIDPNIQVRDVNPYTVATYRNAMRAGAVFPPLVVDRKTQRVVCGNHRYEAYKGPKQPEDKILCEVEDFPDDAAIIRRAVADNARHGKPLDTWDKKKAIHRLKQIGDSLDSIASLLGVTVDKVEELAGMTVIVRGESGEREEPVKRSWSHLIGAKVTEEQYQDHVEHDMGTEAIRIATQLIRWIEKKKINLDDDRTLGRLRELHKALDRCLKVAA